MGEGVGGGEREELGPKVRALAGKFSSGDSNFTSTMQQRACAQEWSERKQGVKLGEL